jgi:MarR family transcriptional regulator, organic hydroperoxide resistance regulator
MTSDTSIGYLIRYAHRAFVKALASELAPYGISTAEWAVFRVLWEDDGYSQVELARRMRIEKASLTSVLRGMERRGLLKRIRDDDDRRRAILSLTVKGRGMREKLSVCAARINRRATNGFSGKDSAALRKLLARSIANLEHGDVARQLNSRGTISYARLRSRA